MKSVCGFSKLSKEEKINWLINHYMPESERSGDDLIKFWHQDDNLQKTFDEFSENTITNYYLPYGVAPNFLINEQLYCVPMVVEESSVVAAAAASAKIWMERGGFKAQVLGSQKIGQIHFLYSGRLEPLKKFFELRKDLLVQSVSYLTSKMQARGGGLKDIELIDLTKAEKNYFQIKVYFETCDAMGANFINSVLEEMSKVLVQEVSKFSLFSRDEKQIKIIMAILSNYTPDSLVESSVECSITDLDFGQMPAQEFAEKFAMAVRISQIDVHRATTHNKGILNGIDAVVLATGNDFRAVEACIHTYAARNGQYRGLTEVSCHENTFKYKIKIPLALGTVGGLTTLHPLAKTSLKLLGNPTTRELSQIVASVGLAQNFAAIKSLITTGIQKGHMKMHLLNILNMFECNQSEKAAAKQYFKDKAIVYKDVEQFIKNVREYQ